MNKLEYICTVWGKNGVPLDETRLVAPTWDDIKALGDEWAAGVGQHTDFSHISFDNTDGSGGWPRELIDTELEHIMDEEGIDIDSARWYGRFYRTEAGTVYLELALPLETNAGTTMDAMKAALAMTVPDSDGFGTASKPDISLSHGCGFIRIEQKFFLKQGWDEEAEVYITGDQPFTCPVCGTRTEQQDSLGRKYERCGNCDATFPVEDAKDWDGPTCQKCWLPIRYHSYTSDLGQFCSLACENETRELKMEAQKR